MASNGNDNKPTGASTSSESTTSADASADATSGVGSTTENPRPRAWDPLSAVEWDQGSPSPIALTRIKRDLSTFFADPPSGIFIVPDENNLTIVHALVIGPYDTPYEGGFFYFLLRCPPDYPIRPPRVRLMTTGGGRVRFNPNLYKDGKVCLSILGTWSGPAWTPAQSFCSVLISIQSLMSENPYHNEPGFETEHRPGDSARYNRVVTYNTVRVAVCDALESHAGTPESLYEVTKESFSQYYHTYLSVCSELEPYEGTRMEDPFGANAGRFQIKALRERLSKLWSTHCADAPEPSLDDLRTLTPPPPSDTTNEQPPSVLAEQSPGEASGCESQLSTS